MYELDYGFDILGDKYMWYIFENSTGRQILYRRGNFPFYNFLSYAYRNKLSSEAFYILVVFTDV